MLLQCTALAEEEGAALTAPTLPRGQNCLVVFGRNHTTTVLKDGRLLVVGGRTRTEGTSGRGSGHTLFLGSVEIYEPIIGKWYSAKKLGYRRGGHSASLLQDGRVLVTGGRTLTEFKADDEHRDIIYASSTEIYDPSTDMWSEVDPMPEARWDHTATVLQDGKVLVTGGFNGQSKALASANIYDPKTNKWTATGNLIVGREGHKAVLMNNGQVMILGGWDTDLVETYDPTTGQWSEAGTLTESTAVPAVATLPNGKIMVAGGFGKQHALATLHLYDPTTSTWSRASDMPDGRVGATITVLRNGFVLLTGGSQETAAFLYDPTNDQWLVAGNLVDAPIKHTATLLDDNSVIIVGGDTRHFGVLRSVEIYKFYDTP